MVRLGMDDEVVESVGRQLGVKGEALRSMVSTVDGLVARASAHWDGHRGRHDLEQWRSVHRRQLLGIADQVDALSRSALDNVAQQREASNAMSTTTHGGSGLMESLMRVAGPGTPGGGLLAGAGGLLTVLEKFNTTSRGTKYPWLYKRLFGGLDFMRYNRTLQHEYSPFLRKLFDVPAVAGLGTAAGFLSIGDSWLGAWNSWHSGGTDAKIEDSGAAVGSAFKAAKNPVSYLVGANITAWSMVAGEATKIDWSRESTAQTFSYIHDHPEVLVEEFGKAAKDMVTDKLWKIFG